MLTVLGVLAIVAGILGGIAVWLLLLVTGILGVVDAVSTSPIDEGGLAWSIVRIVLAEAAGGAASAVGVLLGMFLIGIDE